VKNAELKPDTVSKKSVVLLTPSVRNQFNDTVTDLFLKVPGGMITVKRRFYDKNWHWAPLDSHLQFKFKGSIPETISKEGVVYRKRAICLILVIAKAPLAACNMVANLMACLPVLLQVANKSA